MKRSSWIALAICMLAAIALAILFVTSNRSPERLSQGDAVAIVEKMQEQFAAKNATGILAYLSPASDTRIAGVSPDQLRALLVRYFHNSNRLSAKTSNYAFTGGDTDATLVFDLVVNNEAPDSRAEDYTGKITLHLRRVDVPQMFGIVQSKEWRIVGAETTGQELSTFGE